MAPLAKKPRVEEEEVEKEHADDVAENEPEAPKEPAEKETDAGAPVSADKRLSEPVAFNVQDQTISVMASTVGNMLKPLCEGGFQYLLSGARANTGLKSGRYMFEVKLLEFMQPFEDPSGKNRGPKPLNYLRVGVSTAGSSLFAGSTEESVCFDMDGFFIHNGKKTSVAKKFDARRAVLAVVLNLDAKSPNANTISLFRDGVRMCQPQALPESWKGKALFPTATFRNVTLQYNFGSALAPLPFKCHTLQEASKKEVQVTECRKHEGDKPEVVFPVCLPGEGSFDWLDDFLEKNPHFTELSQRSVAAWAELSGITGMKGKTWASTDRPSLNYNLALMDDLSVSTLLRIAAPLQLRSYVVMELESNLLKDQRVESLQMWGGGLFKRTSLVMVGEPSSALKERFRGLTLKAKQSKSDNEHAQKVNEVKRKKELEKKQKRLEKAKKKAEQIKQKKVEEVKRKVEEAKKKKEAEKAGTAATEDTAAEKKDEKEAEPEDVQSEESEEEAEVVEPAPKATLTKEELKEWFHTRDVPDLTVSALSGSFAQFSLPATAEGFDEVKYVWQEKPKANDYLKSWIAKKKSTIRVENITPGEWFSTNWTKWQTASREWSNKQKAFKAMLVKKAADKKKKENEKSRKKAVAIAAAARKEVLKKAKAALAAKAKENKEEKGAEDAANEEKKEEEEEEEKEEPENEEEEEEEEEHVPVDRRTLDVFGVEDILDLGNGEPLFNLFEPLDWALLSLRFELHALVHAFRKDVGDPERPGIHLDHLPFYYQKYFKKIISLDAWGVDDTKDLLEHIRDTVVVCPKTQVLRGLLPDTMESFGSFAMLTEEGRRERARREILGDKTLPKLKMAQARGQQAWQQASAGADAVNKPYATPGAIKNVGKSSWKGATIGAPAGKGDAWGGKAAVQQMLQQMWAGGW